MLKDFELSEKILKLVERSTVKTVNDLIEEAQIEFSIPRDVAVKHILELQEHGKLKLSNPSRSINGDLRSFVFSFHSFWFWTIIILSAITTFIIYVIPDKYPIVYIRNILGSIFVLFLPGFSLVKTLFPTREINNIERTALSVGMSLAIIPLMGLLLTYTPWGITLTPITFSLLALTIILTILGLLREHEMRFSEK